MNRISIAAAVAATACIIGIPTVAALASNDTTNTRGPSHSQIDDRSGPNRGSDDETHSPTVVPTTAASRSRDDKAGTHAEPGDDHGTDATSSAGSTSVEPGDDNGTHVEPGDDDGGHHGRRG